MNEAAGTVSSTLAREDFAQLPSALRREWLVTNGLGGFACGTVALANTRRYHGLLVAALRPPVERTVMLAKVDVTAHCGRQSFALGCNEFADGTLSPRGFELCCDFRLVSGLPVWCYALAGVVLEQRIWMPHGYNTTCLAFTLRHAPAAVELELTPLCTYRDYHAHTRGGWSLNVSALPAGCTVTAFPGARPYRIVLDRGQFVGTGDWYWNFLHRVEQQRGLDDVEDLFRPGILTARLAPGETVTLVASAEPHDTRLSLREELERRDRLLSSAAVTAPSWVRRLTLAADAFIVRRNDPTPQAPTASERPQADTPVGAAGVTVIAGYPWFTDWGRDTMIALPGLTLYNDQGSIAASVLRTFVAHVSQGMVPNRFPDDGAAPEYNTADATLWLFHALEAYLQVTDDRALLVELYPSLRGIIDWHQRGTRYGIHCDAADGLLHVGEPGIQLTWMDAKVGDWVVTPRTGKPVEINALWHFALTHMAHWASEMGDTRASAAYARSAARVAAAFVPAFWYEEGGYLYDVVESECAVRSEGTHSDPSLRPNQLFAISLGTQLLDERRARAVVDVCARVLLTPVGLRSLAPGTPGYAGQYGGDPRERDGAYHQGTVWSWLAGPFALAHYRTYGDADYVLNLLAGLAAHLDEACLGTISEIFDGNAPHVPRGCFAQAWSVGETLRAWHILSRARQTTHERISHAGSAP